MTNQQNRAPPGGWRSPENVFRLATENSTNPSSPDLQELTRTARLNYLAGRIHNLGPYPLYHLFHSHDAPSLLTLEPYASLPSDFIRDHRGDRLPPFMVGRDR